MAGLFSFIPSPAIGAGISNTESSIPDSLSRALTSPGILIPLLTSRTLLDKLTSISVGQGASRAGTGQTGHIPHSAIVALDTNSAIPLEA